MKVLTLKLTQWQMSHFTSGNLYLLFEIEKYAVLNNIQQFLDQSITGKATFATFHMVQNYHRKLIRWP